MGWLRCFRGIDTLTAILILAELHDFRRFQTAPALMAYVGLVPSEDSSGDKHRRGRITKTGNTLVRRLLVETAWHYQHRPGIGVTLARRRQGQPGRVIAIADTAQQRLCRRFRRLAATHKPRARSWSPSPASWPASCGPHYNRRRPPYAEDGPDGTNYGDGPRRRRMIRGTILRTGEITMRSGRQRSQLASLDCTSSRRSTVMCALPRSGTVTTVYQRDSSSKRPRHPSSSRPAHCPGVTSTPGRLTLPRHGQGPSERSGP